MKKTKDSYETSLSEALLPLQSYFGGNEEKAYGLIGRLALING